MRLVKDGGIGASWQQERERTAGGGMVTRRNRDEINSAEFKVCLRPTPPVSSLVLSNFGGKWG